MANSIQIDIPDESCRHWCYKISSDNLRDNIEYGIVGDTCKCSACIRETGFLSVSIDDCEIYNQSMEATIEWYEKLTGY